MATIAALTGKVSIEGAKQAGDDLKGMSGHLQDSATGLKGLIGQGLAFAGGAIGVASVGDAFGFVKDQLFDMISSGKDANAMQAQLVAGLQSTHDASGMTVASLGTLSDKLMGLTGIDDDSVKSAESMLLTFTNIGKGAFPAATQAAADLATKMAGGAVPSAQQMQQAALQLGKALNDPATGMSALQRVGVTFSAQQKDQIKNFLAMGDTAGAQNVILKEMQKEFGGSAEAAGKANGGMAIFSAEIDNAKQTIGQALIPALAGIMQNVTPLVTGFAQNLPGALNTAKQVFNAVKPALDTTGHVIGAVASGVGNLAATIKQQGPVIQTLEFLFLGIALAVTGSMLPALIASIPELVAQTAAWVADAVATGSAAIAEAAALLPVIAVGAAIGGLILIVKLAIDHWTQITGALGHFKDMILSAPAPIKILAAILLLPIAPILLIIGAVVLLKNHWSDVMSFMGTALHAVVGIAQAIGGAIGGAIKGALNIVITDIDAFIGFLDSISIHIPSIGVGPVHTPAFDWNGLGIPKIPMLARGGDVSGLFYGAEAGMELLTTPGVYRAPAGSHVYNASDTAALLGSGGIPDGPLVIQIAGRTVAQLLWPDLIKEARRAGGIRM